MLKRFLNWLFPAPSLTAEQLAEQAAFRRAEAIDSFLDTPEWKAMTREYADLKAQSARDFMARQGEAVTCYPSGTMIGKDGKLTVWYTPGEVVMYAHQKGVKLGPR